MRWVDPGRPSRGAVFAVVVLLASLATTSVSAQAVYRCVQKGKPVSLQSEPCANNAKTTAIRGYVPERAPTANELAWKRYRTEREMADRNRAMRAAGTSGSAAVLPAGGGECAQAKADRDA